MDATLAPMLCATGALDELPAGEEWVYEPKLNGWRFVAIVTETGVEVYGGRNGSRYTGKLPYIEAELAERLPVGTAVDGELLSPLGTPGDVGSIMRASGAHVPSARYPALTYWLFDVTRVSGTDVRQLTWAKRRELLEQIHLDGALHLKRGMALDANPDTYRTIVELGGEGIVAKKRTSRYINRRCPAWVKFKHEETCDARIIGFKPGTGDLDGLVGAFIVELCDNGAVRTTVKCGTRKRHEEATAHPERWLHTRIEIKHRGIQKSGIPQHPQFGRRRDDL